MELRVENKSLEVILFRTYITIAVIIIVAVSFFILFNCAIQGKFITLLENSALNCT